MKRILSFLLTLLMLVTSLPLNALVALAEELTAENVLSLSYDDRYDVTGKEVEIIDAGVPTSYQVGYGVAEGTLDTAVVTLDGDKLIATGIGTAKVKIDGVTYTITVKAAPISLLLLAGQSNMQGIDGNGSQSIVCPDGMVYATYADRYQKTVEDVTVFAPSALSGQYSTLNAKGGTEGLASYPVYMLTDTGNGREGMDSGIAYEWVKQTGEKVWVINVGYGGSSINQWQSGGVHYEACADLLEACYDTLRREISAGHFTLSHMGYFWCQGCADETQTAAWYADKYQTMHNTLKANFAFDEDTTFEFGGIIPIRSGHAGMGSYRGGVYEAETSVSYYQSYKDLRFNGPRVAQYWMGNNPALSDIWNVCTIQEGWATLPDGTDGVKASFLARYENGKVDYSTQVAQKESWYTPATPADVHDNIHYNQIGYNEIGREAARNALICLKEIEAPTAETTVTFMTWDGFTPAETITSSAVGSSSTLVVPMVSPVWRSKEVTYTVSDGMKYDYYDFLTESVNADGTLKAVGAEGSVKAVARKLSAFHWVLDGEALTDAHTAGITENPLTLAAGSIADGSFNGVRYQAAQPVLLLHDKAWVLEAELDKFTGSVGVMLLGSGQSSTDGRPFLYFRPADGFVGIGYYDGTQYHNHGISLKAHGLSLSDGPHTYRFENRIAKDGTNMVYLSVDGEELGTLTDLYFNSTFNKSGETWLCGKDLAMPYLGTSNAPISGCTVRSLRVWEDGNTYAGKTISILGDSISTFMGVSNNTSFNSTIGNSAVYYSEGSLNVSRGDTWWQQTIDALGMRLLVNNSWSGSTILHTRSGTVGAYVERCVQLHNDHTGEEPDVIAIFMGTNDFSYYQSALGTAEIDYDTLIRANGDGSYTYATPVTSCEAYAIMLHKMTVRYPDAEIYCMTLLPRRAEDYTGDSITDVGQPTAFNAELAKIATRFGAAVVDLENCGISPECTQFDQYITDKRVHPGPLGMDMMTCALISQMLGSEVTLQNISYDLVYATADQTPGTVLNGNPLSITLKGNELRVTVTMGGKDITDAVYKDGVISIPAVTEEVAIKALGVKKPEIYRWEFDGKELASVSHTENPLTKLGGTSADGILSNTYYKLTTAVTLLHDKPWAVEWKASGTWSGMLLSKNATSNASGNNYLFKTTTSTGFIGFGEASGTQYHNYGVALNALGIDTTKEHVYRVENRISADGSNMAYLLVDGVDCGAMNNYYIGGNSDQKTKVDWVSGKDFTFSYIGTSGHALNGCKMEYFQVWEEYDLIPLSAQIKGQAGQLMPETCEIEANEIYASVKNYYLRKGHTLSIEGTDYVFSVRVLKDGNYSTMLKQATADSFTATEDMVVGMLIRKPDKSALTAEEIEEITLYDTQYGMKNVDGYAHRFTVEAETIDGGTATTRAAIFLPGSHSESGTPTRLIMLSHGYSGYLTDGVWYGNAAHNTLLIDNYLQAGYAVFVVDNTAARTAQTPDLGCPQLVDSYYKAYQYATARFNLETKMAIHSRSFGTFAAIRFMKEHPELVKCGLMTGPRVSLELAFNGVDKTFVANRFGFDDATGATYETEKMAGHDPYADINGDNYRLPPTFWMMSEGDQTAEPLSFITKLTDHGNIVTSKTYTGTDHTGVCSLNSTEMMADALAYLEEYRNVLPLSYDDRYDVTGKEVEIIDAGTPTSDGDAVVALEGNVLRAVGVGTAEVKIDGLPYTITVKKAKINLVMIMGQSNSGNHFANATSGVTCPAGTAYHWGYGATQPTDYTQPSMGFHAPLLAELYAQSVAAGDPVKNVLIWAEGYTSKNGQSITAWAVEKNGTIDTTGTDGAAEMLRDCLAYYEGLSDRYEICDKVMFCNHGTTDHNMDTGRYIRLFTAIWERLKAEGMEHVGFLRVRGAHSLNTPENVDLYYNSASAAQFELVRTHDDMFMASTITENWTGVASTIYSIDISRYLSMMEAYGQSPDYSDSYGNKATFADGILTTTMKELYGSNNKVHYGIFGYGIIGADAAYNMYHALNGNGTPTLVQTDSSGTKAAESIVPMGSKQTLDIEGMDHALSFYPACGSPAGILQITVTSEGRDITEQVVSLENSTYGCIDTAALRSYPNAVITVSYTYGGKTEQVAYTLLYHHPCNDGHDYTATVTPPTCTEKGYTTYTCACGESYVGDHTDVLPFRLLMIGNSFSHDAARQLRDILKAMLGEDSNVEIHLAINAAKTMAWHATQASENAASYKHRYITEDGKWVYEDEPLKTLEEIMAYADWTAVTLQSYAPEATTGTAKGLEGETTSFLKVSDSVPFLLDYIHEHAPNASIYYYLIWQTTTDTSVLNAGLDGYREIASLAQEIAAMKGKESGFGFQGVIPVGTAVQNARSTYLGLLNYKAEKEAEVLMGLQRDSVHMAYTLGGYIAALTIAEYLIPADGRLDEYALPAVPNSSVLGKLPPEYTVIAQKAVAMALEHPYSVTARPGYETDPAGIAQEAFENLNLTFAGIATEEELKNALLEAANSVLPREGFAVPVVTLTDSTFSADGTLLGYHGTVTFRFGYTTCIATTKKHPYTATVTQPTCTEKGYTTYTCACGESYVADEVAATGHSYANGICTVCGEKSSPYLQQLPENIIGCTNLYDLLTPVKGYYTATKYDTTNGDVLSVVIPVESGDRISASSFGSVSENMGSANGIRVTYLLDGVIVESLSASSVYAAYTQDGYLTVPEGVNMVCVPWWKPSENNWLNLSQISKDYEIHKPKNVPAQAPTCTENGYTAGEICEICNASIGTREEIPAVGHKFSGNFCTVCGAFDISAFLSGKYVSILGDSISTFNGYSNDGTVNTTIGANGPRYDVGTADTKPGSYCLLESVDDTWWMHFANRNGMHLLVNNSWAGSQVFGGKTADGRVIPAAYLERCVNLHDNTLENNPNNAPIDPDVIFVYLGINDYNFNRTGVGSGTVDYAKLIGSDGTYVTPASFGEAYGILLHKMKTAYPDAQIFAMTLLPENLYSIDMAAWEMHNAYIRAAADYYGIPVVDLAENCAITWENYSGYMMDKIHPTTAGMKLISDCIQAELTAYYTENPPHIHSYTATVTPPTCTEKGYTTYTCECGHSYVGDEVTATGHSYSAWESVKAPTQGNNGILERKCKNCDVKETVEHSYHFSDFTYVAFGDSITYGIDGVDWGLMAHPYPNLVTETLGFHQLVNKAVSGATFCENTLGRKNMTQVILSYTGEADVISLMLGVNDFYANLPLGTAESRDNTTVYGSLHLISQYLTTHYADSFIFYMTPFPAKKGPYPNEQGYKLEDVANAIKEVAAEYSIPVLDTFTLGEYDKVEMNSPDSDGIHPSQSFTREYTVPKIVKFIAENYNANPKHPHRETILPGTTPTCTEEGISEGKVCALCGEILVAQEILPATGHSYESVVTKPTCTAEGYTTYTCHCGDSYVADKTPATGHTFGEWTTVKEATCTANGEQRRDCKNCDVYETKVIAATGHSYTAVVTKPTCTAEGYTTYTCNCGDTYVDKVPATGHSFGEWYTTKDATCTVDGEQRRDCKNCDHYETKVIEAIGHNYQATITKPTCTTEGYTTYTCHCGDSYVADKVPATGHSFGNWETVKEATCTENGEQRRDCANCDHYETMVIEAIGHSYQATVTKPTCIKEGYTTYTCHCGDSYVADKVPASGHSFGEWYITKEATCTANGEQRRNCVNCDVYETKVIAATGHSFGRWHTLKEPTCAETGIQRRDCDLCEHYETSPIAANGHTYSYVVTPPTCTGKGFTTHTCTVCGDSYISTIVLPLGHSYESVVTPPTCTEGGFTTYTCTVCGDSYQANFSPAMGHVYDSTVTTPTCTEQGYTTYTCTVCKESYVSNYIQATGHSYESVVTDPTCTEKGYVTYTCHCGDTYTGNHIPAVGHSWDEGVITVEPTEEQAGCKVYTCTVCGETKEETLPPLEHIHGYEGVVTEPTCTEQGYTTYTCRCGDSYVSDHTDAKGHSFGEWETVKDATCTADGEERRDCANCDVSETQTIAATGHKYDAIVTEPTCTEQGFTTYTCHCGDSYVSDYVDPAGHAWSEWYDTAPGKEERACGTCGETEIRDKIPDYDVDGNGIVEEADVTLLMSVLVGNTETDVVFDFDFDGELTIYDCVLLMQQID